MAAVEVGAAACEVAADRVGCGTADRDDALLAALAEAADEPLVEVDGAPVEPDGLAHPQPRAVQQLDERRVAKRARLGPGRGLDQSLSLARRQRPRQPAHTPRGGDLRGRIVLARAE